MGSGGFWLLPVCTSRLWCILVGCGAVLVGSGGFWCSSGGVLVWFLWVLVNSGGFWWVLVYSGAVLVGSGRVLVGSCEFW